MQNELISDATVDAAQIVPDRPKCNSSLVRVKDALEVLSGKWKLQIILTLMFGNQRFKEISRDIGGITDRMLSKELKELESHQLVKRTVIDAFPPIVQYELTEHGETLRTIISELNKWGDLHKATLFNR